MSGGTDSLDVMFCRRLLSMAHERIKLHFPEINVRTAAWVWTDNRRHHWEFHGPDRFYWHGRASNAYDARYAGWIAWLRSKGIEE